MPSWTSTRLLLAVLLVGATLVRAAGADDLPPEAVLWQTAADLPVELLGTPIPVAWIADVGLFRVPESDRHVQLLAFKESRDSQVLHFASLDLASGRLRLHADMPGYEVLRREHRGGKVYLGMNLPSHLLEYDPASDTLCDLGKAFEHGNTVISMAVGPDGVIALGSAAGSEVDLYDPGSGQFTRYGRVGDGYIYTIGLDEHSIYCADRGDRWQWVVVDRRTKARSVVLTAPEHGYINVRGNRAEVRFERDAPLVEHAIVDGRAVVAPPRPAPPPPALPLPQPEVLLDTADTPATGRLTVHYRLPGDKPAEDDPTAAPSANGWQSQTLAVPLDRSIPIHRLVATDDGQIVGTMLSYGGLFAYNPATDAFRILGSFDPISVIGIGQRAGMVYVSGYPGAAMARVDLSRPFTHPTSRPGAPGVPWADPQANPWLIDQLGKELESAHETAAMEVAANGRIYLTGMRFRYHKGFSLGWFDPATAEHGKVEDDGLLDQLQVSWMCPMDGGRRLAISTRVQPDERVGGPPPVEGKVFLFDTDGEKFAVALAPLPGETMLGPVADVGDGRLVGICADIAASRTVIYRLDTASGEVEARRVYEGIVCGIPSKGDVPRKSHDFQTGPDGHVWTVYQLPYADAPALIVRIDPADLRLHLVGKVPGGSIRMLFQGRDMYLTGAPQLRRLKGIVPAH